MIIAQLLAIAGNLNCRAECDDLKDLIQCFRLMGSYNGFDHTEAERWFKKFNLRQYYNQDNCNNGNDLFKYSYGWEGSHVVYISCNWYCSGAKCIAPDGKHYREFTQDDFQGLCRWLGGKTAADESDISEDHDGKFLTWRLWWD